MVQTRSQLAGRMILTYDMNTGRVSKPQRVPRRRRPDYAPPGRRRRRAPQPTTNQPEGSNEEDVSRTPQPPPPPPRSPIYTETREEVRYPGMGAEAGRFEKVTVEVHGPRISASYPTIMCWVSSPAPPQPSSIEGRDGQAHTPSRQGSRLQNTPPTLEGHGQTRSTEAARSSDRAPNSQSHVSTQRNNSRFGASASDADNEQSDAVREISSDEDRSEVIPAGGTLRPTTPPPIPPNIRRTQISALSNNSPRSSENGDNESMDSTHSDRLRRGLRFYRLGRSHVGNIPSTRGE